MEKKIFDENCALRIDLSTMVQDSILNKMEIEVSGRTLKECEKSFTFALKKILNQTHRPQSTLKDEKKQKLNMYI